MHDLDWTTIKDLFADALDRPKESRDEFVARRSNGNDALYNEVISLLRSAEEPDDLIESNAIDLVSKVVGETENYAERHFGIYRIIRELGTGGMGSVFLAERDDGEFTMQVALKIVRASIADRVTTERFRQERQILAKLHHPNIAALHDGGISEKGEPFLAMEFVDGQSLIDHCESKNLSIRERLILFCKVCSAVSYAHRNLVVHRDIKPSNILITNTGEPKLLDFGLAKVFDSDGQKTQTVLRAFTPAYASPEQIKGENITTASDIYSLGVVFYELLTGVKPLIVEDKSYEKIVETITRVEPLPPSRVSTSSQNLAAAFRPRQTLRGDLDNIALTALNKEPDRRYRSVEAFADDVESYLKGFPVSARPRTISYRASKFLKRNKVAVVAASLIVAIGLAALGISYRQYRETERQKTKAEDVKGFLQKMLLSTVPEASADPNKVFDPAMNRMLEEAAARLETDEMSRQPEVKIELQQLIGAIYLRQGQVEPALKCLRAALDTAVVTQSGDTLQLTRTKGLIGSAEFGRANYQEAGRLFDEAIPGLRQALLNGQLEPAEGLGILSDHALLERAVGDSRAAEASLRDNLDIASKINADEKLAQTSRIYLGLTLADQGKFDEAQKISDTIVASARLDGGRSVFLANVLTFHGIVRMEQGDLTGAGSILREGEAIYRAVYAADSIFTFDNLRLQAEVAYREGNYPKAKVLIESVLENYRSKASPKFNSFATALSIQGQILTKTGRGSEAEAILRDAVRLRSENLPAGHFMTAVTLGALGECLTGERKFEEAETVLNESLTALQSSQDPSSPRLTAARDRLKKLQQARTKP